MNYGLTREVWVFKRGKKAFFFLFFLKKVNDFTLTYVSHNNRDSLLFANSEIYYEPILISLQEKCERNVEI